MHLRLPSFAPGVTAFLWALVLSVYAWLLMTAIGVSQGTALVVSLLLLFGIFVFVRLRGRDERGA